jgi:predicted nucleotidyltransferase component of viral defense system
MISINELVSFYPDKLKPFKKNILREYLQYKILQIIYDSNHFNALVFMGGTAIRIIYGNTRFSEDLDFDNISLTQDNFKSLMNLLKKKLELEGYNIETKFTFKGAFRCQLKFIELLSNMNLSNHKDAKLIIQVDTEPQNYKYQPKKVLINKFDVFTRIISVPVDLLLSQKITAFFTRKRLMGRDLFDIVFLHSKTNPDLNYLKQKLNITNSSELKKQMLSKCGNIDFNSLAKDVSPFIFNPNDSKKILFFKEYIETKF